MRDTGAGEGAIKRMCLANVHELIDIAVIDQHGCVVFGDVVDRGGFAVSGENRVIRRFKHDRAAGQRGQHASECRALFAIGEQIMQARKRDSGLDAARLAVYRIDGFEICDVVGYRQKRRHGGARGVTQPADSGGINAVVLGVSADPLHGALAVAHHGFPSMSGGEPMVNRENGETNIERWAERVALAAE